jgi:prolyl 4-hydroxylase
MAMSDVQAAEQLIRSGSIQQALELLGRAGARGDADALEQLATFALRGDIVRRDLALSRNLFGKAGQLGSASAAATYRAFLANGTGGATEWNEALRLLDEAGASDPAAAHERDLISAMQLNEDGAPLGPLVPEQLSTAPEASIFRSLFTEAECDFLISAAQPMLQPSKVVDPATGALVANPVRTSDAAPFPLSAEGPAIHALCRRLALASGTDVKQGEPLQVLRYAPGQEYRPHFDSIDRADNQRILTFLVYLNDGYEGGETRFMQSGLTVKGNKGDGLLFRNASDDGRRDLNSQHAGLAVTAGEKFIASRWIRQRALNPAR